MHFNQEPLLYFALGPMWETYSDQLLTSTHKNSGADLQCINSIIKNSAKDKIAIIILLDALRSDHLPMYGYNRNTTPFLDSLYKKKQLIKIKNSFSTSTNTIGGISGLFYSKAWDDFNYSQLNMMQYFQLSGYSTSAFLTGYHSGWYGLSAMYRGNCDNFYESTSAYHTAIDDDLVTLRKIESTPLKPGSFIFIHLLSTHPVGKRDPEFRIYKPDKIGLNTNNKEVLINNYDNGILQGDYVIRQVFKKLQKENLLDKVTLFIVGDHGDLIGEDGLYGHSTGLHEKLLEVPILIYDKDTAWYKENRIASLIDIAPTLSDKFFGHSPLCWQGKSLHTQFDIPFSTKVSASTIKTNLANGSIYFTSDSLKLEIFDKTGELQKVALKVDSINWETIYKK
ncbi:sulfatase-like hydrolase/transferase [Terrimonas alba]|uniref:sulfatase-like hydrolase/transferase n=1 Tax=Terrimonas alba TaxID=3349636 RepID=UPI0035F418EF